MITAHILIIFILNCTRFKLSFHYHAKNIGQVELYNFRKIYLSEFLFTTAIILAIRPVQSSALPAFGIH